MSDINVIFEDVRLLVVDTLGVEPEEVQAASHWECDLGGESIDLIDLKFRLEKHFGIAVQFPGNSVELAVDERGFLTASTLTQLRTQYPFLELDTWRSRPFTHH